MCIFLRMIDNPAVIGKNVALQEISANFKKQQDIICRNCTSARTLYDW